MNINELIKQRDGISVVNTVCEEYIKDAELQYSDHGTQIAYAYGRLKWFCGEVINELKEATKARKPVTLSSLTIETLLPIYSLEIPLSIEVKYKPELTGEVFPILKGVGLWEVNIGNGNIIDLLSSEEKYNIEQLCIDDYLKTMEQGKTEFELRQTEAV